MIVMAEKLLITLYLAVAVIVTLLCRFSPSLFSIPTCSRMSWSCCSNLVISLLALFILAGLGHTPALLLAVAAITVLVLAAVLHVGGGATR